MSSCCALPCPLSHLRIVDRARLKALRDADSIKSIPSLNSSLRRKLLASRPADREGSDGAMYSLALLDTMAKSSAGSLRWRGSGTAEECRAHTNATADRVGLARALQVYGLHGVLDTCVEPRRTSVTLRANPDSQSDSLPLTSLPRAGAFGPGRARGRGRGRAAAARVGGSTASCVRYSTPLHTASRAGETKATHECR